MRKRYFKISRQFSKVQFSLTTSAQWILVTFGFIQATFWITFLLAAFFIGSAAGGQIVPGRGHFLCCLECTSYLAVKLYWLPQFSVYAHPKERGTQCFVSGQFGGFLTLQDMPWKCWPLTFNLGTLIVQNYLQSKFWSIVYSHFGKEQWFCLVCFCV